MKSITNENIKWQIHAETSVTQIMLWIIIAKLFGGWFLYIVTGMFIVGNIFTLLKSVSKLPKDYFKL